ncbi:hypothetical protein SRABI80_03731 [Peribacillus frigoritolerans]|uniref:restriction endonuclease, SacI family n=1 Tax=Peribacillus frigoritolerans TaxID=450367 RepID=UPI001D22E308|nr:restriction endonuclease, SacI family [Peribacillus frigoritolerans]CAH0281639.1 hypothetical protein SRABI80_03731 [Peribacillus frigoritolerans]
MRTPLLLLTRVFFPKSKFTEEIYSVLNENHLTYKYILVNALLAKASFPEINMICLQKQSKLVGAYDARSLCHQVLVPFEEEKLFGAFGSSIEPFLNKPARVPELSTSNLVRKGRDSRILVLLCSFLPKVNTKELAFEALTDAIYYAIQLAKDKEEMIGSLTVNTPSFLYCIEAKDKKYASQDVMHAVQKAADSQCIRLMFITGPQGKLVNLISRMQN